MTSFRQILGAQTPLLLLDAASSRIQAGLWGQDGAVRWESSDEEAGVGIFRCVEALQADPDAMRAFVFCAGPGSILGIRTVAMALRTWCATAPRPFYAYSSLALVSHALPDFSGGVIADARRNAWHLYRKEDGLRRMPTEALSGNLLMPEGFRNWTPLPPGVGRTPYGLAQLLPQVAGADLFQAIEAPDAFLHEEPQYASWTPQLHRR